MKKTLTYHLFLLLILSELNVNAQVNYSKEQQQILQEVRGEFEAMIAEMRLVTSREIRRTTSKKEKPANLKQIKPDADDMTRATEDKTLAFAPPVTGDHTISSYFGYRIDPFTRERAFHNGIDVPLPRNTPVLASLDGVVLKARKDRYGGKFVLLKHKNHYMTLYEHLSGILVTKGERIKKGQIIGYSGNTGRSTGPHLHFEVYLNEKPINPLSLLTLKSSYYEN